MTFESVTLSPTRKPSRNTTATASHGAGTIRRSGRGGLRAAPRRRNIAQHPREQVDQRRVGERDRGPDVGVVEEGQRDRERQQHQQVQVEQRQWPAEVEERRDEQQAQREPDVERVDVLSEGPPVAPGHRPGDLEAAPSFEHPPRGVGDDHLREFPAPVAREEAHLPAQGPFGVDRPVGAGVPAAGVPDLGHRAGDRQHPAGREGAAGQPVARHRHLDQRFRDRLDGRPRRCVNPAPVEPEAPVNRAPAAPAGRPSASAAQSTAGSRRLTAARR